MVSLKRWPGYYWLWRATFKCSQCSHFGCPCSFSYVRTQEPSVMLRNHLIAVWHVENQISEGQVLLRARRWKSPNISIPHQRFCSWKVTSPAAVESDRGLQAAPYFYSICSARSCSGRFVLDFNFQRCLWLQELRFICQNLDTEVLEKFSVGNECPSKLFQPKSFSGPDHADMGSSQSKAM